MVRATIPRSVPAPYLRRRFDCSGGVKIVFCFVLRPKSVSGRPTGTSDYLTCQFGRPIWRPESWLRIAHNDHIPRLAISEKTQTPRSARPRRQMSTVLPPGFHLTDLIDPFHRLDEASGSCYGSSLLRRHDASNL